MDKHKNKVMRESYFVSTRLKSTTACFFCKKPFHKQYQAEI